MPRVCRYMVKTGLGWLLAGYTVGGVLLVNKALNVFEPIWSLRSSHIYMLLFGWLVQMVMGVMVWIMPRLVATGDRGNMRLAWVSYVALNTALVLAALHGPLVRGLGESPLAWMTPLAAVLLLIALASFMRLIWERIRPMVELPPPQADARVKE